MSAFVCSDYHLSVLAAFVSGQERPSVLHEGKRVDLADAVEVGGILHAENVRSVEELYSEYGIDWGTFTFDKRALRVWKTLAPVQVIKAAQCYLYQSCETADWEGTLAHRIVNRLIQDACMDLPGYDDATWRLEPAARKRTGAQRT